MVEVIKINFIYILQKHGLATSDATSYAIPVSKNLTFVEEKS